MEKNMTVLSRLLASFGLITNSQSQLNNLKFLCYYGTLKRFFSIPAKNAEECLPLKRSNLPILNINYDVDYICNPKNHSEIISNINNRKGIGNIFEVQRIWDKLNTLMIHPKNDVDDHSQEESFNQLLDNFLNQIAKIPNRTHPDVIIGDETKARILETVGQKREFNFKPKTFEKLCLKLDLLHLAHLGHVSDSRSYFFKGALANLEQALIQFCVDRLSKAGFTLMSVPDLLHPSIIENCGMMVRSEKNPIYSLDPTRHGNICLSGTAEMAIAGYFMNKRLKMEDLPQKLAAISRCYRAEIAQDIRKIYRVHEFTKIEMFAVIKAKPNESDIVLNELVNIEKQLFTELGLHFRILDMPSLELGASAYRKFDIEAWMPGHSTYGEISSASNCTDFQSRRLNITYCDSDNPDSSNFVHTLNATACAIPRMLIALLETHQQKDGSIHVVEALQPYFRERRIRRPNKIPKLHWIKCKYDL